MVMVINNEVDIDSDNDGIPDNVEAQTNFRVHSYRVET